MVGYHFPPARLVSSKRLGHFYKEALSFFEDIFVLTSATSEAYDMDSLLDFPVENKEAFRHRDFRSSVQQQTGLSSRLTRRLKQYGIGRNLLHLRKRWPFFYWFGDGGQDYIQQAVKRAEALIKDHQITHLFTSYGPYADLIVGYKLKKQHSKLTWIADFRDIFENKPTLDPYQRNPFWYMEKKVKLADQVTTVSEGLAQRLRLIHPSVSVLYNGIGEFSQHPQTVPPSLPVTISYTGSMYDRWHALEVFFQVLKACNSGTSDSAEQIQFRYFGTDASECQSRAEEVQVESHCTVHDPVSMAQALRFQKESHIDLLLSWSHTRQKGVLNAKLFEYLGAGRPIFAVVTGPRDEELSYWVETVGRGKCFFTAEHALSEMGAGLNALIELVRSGRWEAPENLPPEIYWSRQGPKFMSRILEKTES